MIRKKIYLVLSLILITTVSFSNTYLKSDRDPNTELLSKILKEIESLKKGQEKLANDIKAIKSAGSKTNPSKPAPTAAQSATVKNIPTGDSMVLGNPDAPVTIHKWTDFQWPYCAKSVRLIDDILKMHKDEVKVVVKDFPLNFHKQARDAAKVALAADKQKTCGPSKNESCYKDMYHLIFCGTTDSVMPDQCNAWRKLKTNPDLPYEYATQLNLDLVKLKQDAKDPALENLIKKEGLELSQNFERKSVPKFLVAGREPKGRDLKTFSDMIKAELAKKK